MRTTLKVAGLGLAVMLVVTPGFFAADGSTTTSTHPPKTLKKVGDHWTPWDPPQSTTDSYSIQQGDTLWDLAGKWLGDPHLWPQVWDQNRYVLDSHWIYPGDPLAVPPKPNVVPPEGPPPSAETQPAAGEPAAETAGSATAEIGAPPAAPPAPPAPPALIQLADQHDLYCSGWVDGDRHPSTLVVQGGELEKRMQADGDVIFLNQGRNQGISPGAEFLVVRADHPVVHPATNETLGTYMQRMGHIRVLCTQENTATAVVVSSCENVMAGDELLPWKELSSPVLERVPTSDRCQDPSGLAQGWVVDGGADERFSLGTGDVVATDLGTTSGIRPGSLLTLFRNNGDYPRLVLGQAVVLTVDGSTSTVKVLHTSRDVRLGDRAEVFRQ